MKFNCDRYRDYRKAKAESKRVLMRQWHPWFAWYPKKIANGDCRWLETIERVYHPGTTVAVWDDFVTYDNYWEYRAPTTGTHI